MIARDDLPLFFLSHAYQLNSSLIIKGLLCLLFFILIQNHFLNIFHTRCHVNAGKKIIDLAISEPKHVLGLMMHEGKTHNFHKNCSCNL